MNKFGILQAGRGPCGTEENGANGEKSLRKQSHHHHFSVASVSSCPFTIRSNDLFQRSKRANYFWAIP
jgi:hypothetical protein